MALCSERGRFLFEVRPDLFPEGRLVQDELSLWSRWYEEREQRNKRR